MKLSATIIKSLLILLLIAGLIGCREDIEMVIFEPSELSFNPPLTTFNGQPGDDISMEVNINGESTFKNLKLVKFLSSEIEEEFYILPTKEEQYAVPYQYLFNYTLKPEEIGKIVRFSFIMESEISDPQKGRMTVSTIKNLDVITIAP